MMTTVSESEEPESVRAAVANELRRRKRVLTAYLCLIAVPVSLAAYAVARAPSESDALAKETTPIVLERADQEIERRVKGSVESNARPIIQEAVSVQLPGAVEESVEPIRSVTQTLQSDYASLNAQVDSIDGMVRRDAEMMREVQPRFAELDQFRERLGQIEGTARDAMGGVTMLRDGQRQLSQLVEQNTARDTRTAEALQALDARVARLEKQLGALQSEVKLMRDNTRFRRPVTKVE